MSKQQCLMHVHGGNERLILAMDCLGNEQVVEWWYVDAKGTGHLCVQFEEGTIAETLYRWSAKFHVEATVAYFEGGVPRVFQAQQVGGPLASSSDIEECLSVLGNKESWQQECETGKAELQKRRGVLLGFVMDIVTFARKVSLEDESVIEVADSLVRELLRTQLDGKDAWWERFCDFLRSVAGRRHAEAVRPVLGSLDASYRKLGMQVGLVEMAGAMTFLEDRHFMGD